VNKKQKLDSSFFIWTDEEIYEQSFYKQHLHNFYQTVFVKKGNLKYTLKSTITSLRYGDFLTIPPDVPHCPVGGQDPALFASIEMKFTLTPQLQKAFPFGNSPLIIQVQPESIEYVEAVLGTILREWRRQSDQVQEALHHLVHYLFLTLNREHSAPASDLLNGEPTVISLARNRKKKVAEHIQDFLENHYNQPVNFGKLARENNISLSYLSEIFKDQYKLSLSEYLNTVRINKAKELMKTSELNFTQIAEKVGYQNVYYFSKVFKDLNKITPSQYRDLVNQNLQNMGYQKVITGGSR
jgi:AraC-like DNA-binding protein